MISIPYSQGKQLIKEADVLLFRATKFPGVGWWIGKYTRSTYSHTGLAHWENDQLYCVEFREFIGSRKYPMDDYINEVDGRGIDVFRSLDTVIAPCLIPSDPPKLCHKEYNFTADVAECITNTALKLIGKKYSYWTIWQMFKTYVPFIRLRTKVVKNGELDPTKFVCSTLVTYAYRTNFIDPVPFLSDGYTSPGDLGRSGLFSYLFTIK